MRCAFAAATLLPHTVVDLKKLDRYIVKKFISTLFFMVLIMIVIILVIDVAEKVDDFIDKKVPMREIVFVYYANFIPFLVNKLSPVCVFLAVIFFTAKMTQDSEVVAILSSGVSFYRFMAPYLVTAVWLSFMSFYLNAYVVPTSAEKWMNFEFQYLKGKRVFEGRNIHKKVDQQSFIYIYSYNQYDNQGYLFTLEERDSTQRLRRKLDANTLQWIDSTQQWRLVNAKERIILQDRELLRSRQQMDTAMKLAPNDIYIRENQAQTLALDELNAYIDLERDRGSDFLYQLLLERNERFAYPVAAIILTIMGVALSTKKQRGGIALQIGLGLILTFAYILILSTAKVAIGDRFPNWVATWMPNLIFIGISAFLIRIAPK